MVLITNYLGAQSVDPETFPSLNSENILGKYLYTNTGGEGKIAIDTIYYKMKNRVMNGIQYNGVDTLKLGGSLTENTSIYMGNYSYINWSVIPSFYGGTSQYALANAHTISGCSKNISTSSYNNLDYTAIQTGLDTCIGELHTELAYGNIITGQRKQLVSKYSGLRGGELFINLYTGDGAGGDGTDGIDIIFDDTNDGARNAMRFAPNTNFTGDYIDVNSFLKILNNCAIVLNVPTYADDASADADTNLPSGGLYKLTGNRTLFVKP